MFKSPGDYYVASQAGNIEPNKVYISITGNKWKVWGNTQLQSIDLDYLAMDPLNIATFDKEVDDYPVGEDVWAVMKALAVAELFPESLKPADTINDSAQSQERGNRGK
jgi:hypothetical protein